MNKKLLLVDDDQAFRDALAEVLTASNLGEILTAEDGQEALDMLAEQDVDLLITDINMPRLTGIGLISQLRSKGSTLPVIVVTGVTHGLDKVAELDVSATLLKPFKFRALVHEIQKILSGGAGTA